MDRRERSGPSIEAEDSEHEDRGGAWWHDAVVYQIYPRSFCDANRDGIGDLPGVTSRLDDLVDLGVDAIWLSPFYPSPMADGGYDVADYCAVDPRFGTLDDFDTLVAEARLRGIRVIVDIVPNHCSSAHPWFSEALAAGPGSDARRRFIFREGRGHGGEDPPNDWGSNFGGPAWTKVPDGEWYLHLFDTAQPDWNWRHPEVRALFDDVLRFWLDRGVAGIRVDVADHLFKDPDLPDDATRVPGSASTRTHRPELLDLYREWRAILDSYDPAEFPGARTAIGEHWSPPRQLHPYLDDGLPQALNTVLLLTAWAAGRHRRGDRSSRRGARRTAVDPGQPRRGPTRHAPWCSHA